MIDKNFRLITNLEHTTIHQMSYEVGGFSYFKLKSEYCRDNFKSCEKECM